MPDPARPWAPDPRLAGVPSDVLRARQDRPLDVRFPALEHAAIQLSAVTSPLGRGLYEWELAVIRDVFQRGVDAARVRVVEANVLNAPTTLGNQIRVPYGWSFERDNRPVLVHEVAHVWQYQTQGAGYISDSVYHNASGAIATGNRNVAYMNYRLTPGSGLLDFTAEEQATIVGDYYELTRIYQNDPSPPAWVQLRRPDLPLYERLIAQVRSATPRSDAAVYQQDLMNQPQRGVDLGVPPERQMAPTMPLVQFRF